MNGPNKSTIVNLERGKIPPQDVALEERVIGALLIQPEAIEEVYGILKPEHFYKDAHRFIYKSIEELHEKKEGVDLLTVSNQLRKNGNLENVGGDFYVIGLSQKIQSSAHIEFHSRIIMQKSMMRDLIKLSSTLIEDAYDDTSDVFDVIDVAYDSLSAISSGLLKTTAVKISQVVAKVIKKGLDIFSGKVDPGIKTPITHLTEKTGGFRDGELIILAARPGMGKTAFALSCGTNCAKNGIPSAFISLEMNKETLTVRVLSMEAEVDGKKFNSTGLSPEDFIKIQNARKPVDEMPFYIEDTNVATIENIRLKAKKLYKEQGVRFFIFDYIQLASGDDRQREQAIAKISRGLKMLATELNCPVLALSQLSRSVESRGGTKRPLLSDLRESGAIEQDADMVIFIYRPEYYGLADWDDYGEVSCISEAEYIVAKNRNGGLVRNRMSFTPKYTKFEDLKDDFNPQETILFNPKENEKDENDVPF